MARGTTAGAERLWTRDFVLATVVNALAMSIFYLLMTTMAVYAVREFAASATGAGLASSMFIVGAVVTRGRHGPLALAALARPPPARVVPGPRPPPPAGPDRRVAVFVLLFDGKPKFVQRAETRGARGRSRRGRWW